MFYVSFFTIVSFVLYINLYLHYANLKLIKSATEYKKLQKTSKNFAYHVSMSNFSIHKFSPTN